MKKQILENPPYFDSEEAETIKATHEAFDNNSVISVLTPELADRLQTSAENTKVKITTRLRRGDLARLKTQAGEKGLPYQTLLASIVHQYVQGNLVERSSS